MCECEIRCVWDECKTSFDFVPFYSVLFCSIRPCTYLVRMMMPLRTNTFFVFISFARFIIRLCVNTLVRQQLVYTHSIPLSIANVPMYACSRHCFYAPLYLFCQHIHTYECVCVCAVFMCVRERAPLLRAISFSRRWKISVALACCASEIRSSTTFNSVPNEFLYEFVSRRVRFSVHISMRRCVRRCDECYQR